MAVMRPTEFSRPPVVLIAALACLVAAIVVREWIWAPILVTGHSMLPTFNDGQIAGVNKLAYALWHPRRHEIVVIWTGAELLVKRVVGLPGEEIALRNGTFYVNGAELREPYLTEGRADRSISCGKIAPDCFVVAGDNRVHGGVAVVAKKRIVGRVVVFSHHLIGTGP